MNIEIKGSCKYCDKANMPYSALLQHLQENHKEECDKVFQHIDSKPSTEAEVLTIPYKAFIAELWRQFREGEKDDDSY